MSERPEINRRELFTRWFRGRSFTRASAGTRGGPHESEESPEAKARREFYDQQIAPNLDSLEDNMDLVLERMDDLSGIVDS
jgi:hypothetical protein